MEDDFETLKKSGIDVKGKIVICRYGKIFRGNKVKFKSYLCELNKKIYINF